MLPCCEKTDLTNDTRRPSILREEAEKFVFENKLCGYLECSAESGSNVEEAFRLLLQETRKPDTPTHLE